MRFNGKHIACIALFSILLTFSQNVSGQQQEIDTSDYVPSYSSNYLDYNLLIAASKGYSTEIERLIKAGANVNIATIEGVNALIYAVISGKYEAVNTLLSFKPELDNKTLGDETALLIAVKNNYFEITEALIRAGADLNLGDRFKATPLHYATLYGYFDIVDLLIYYGAEIDDQSDGGITPLLTSVRTGYTDITDLLVQNGANLELSDNDGFTPFLTAAYFGDTIVMDILLKKGADIYAVNNKGHNALNLTISGNHPEATRYLLRIGDQWSHPGSDVISPYVVATKYRRKDIIDLLKKNNIQGGTRLGIDQVAISAMSKFGGHDFFSGLDFSFKEPYLNAGFRVGSDFKLWYTKVLVKSGEHTFYQYLDKSALVYAGIFKDFTLTNNAEGFNYLFSTSLCGGYTFGNKLKGSSAEQKGKFRIIPSVSLKITKMNFSLVAGIEYQKTDFYKTGPLWLRAGITYNYFFDNVRIKLNPIKWQ